MSILIVDGIHMHKFKHISIYYYSRQFLLHCEYRAAIGICLIHKHFKKYQYP